MKTQDLIKKMREKENQLDLFGCGCAKETQKTTGGSGGGYGEKKTEVAVPVVCSWRWKTIGGGYADLVAVEQIWLRWLMAVAVDLVVAVAVIVDLEVGVVGFE